jgi:hypothetical protein
MTYTRATTLLLTAFLAAGCMRKTETTLNPPPPETDNLPKVTNDARERVKELGTLAEEFAAGADKLPGRNDQDDRAEVTRQFALLSQLLPMLNGPDMSGDFKQQLGIVSSTKALLGSGSQDLAVEPTIDTGLRAAHRALTSISQRSFIEKPEVAKNLENMRGKIEELDGASGPMHRLVTSQALRASAQAVTQMASALDQRLNDSKGKAETKPADNKADAKPVQ